MVAAPWRPDKGHRQPLAVLRGWGNRPRVIRRLRLRLLMASPCRGHICRLAVQGGEQMIDLSTSYLGMPLKNPLVVSASPLCEDLDKLRRMEDAGAAAIVLHSLFEEQITLESQE